ncbi:MAG: hypothetical protein ACLR5G_01375 [Eubacteriales bacterium]
MTRTRTEHECRAYAEDVVWRFSNPFIHHKCRSIALNSIDKYRVRVLPSVLDYERFTGKPPVHLLFALAKLIEMYKTDPPDDAKEYVDFMEKSGVGAILSNREFWGTDLTRFGNMSKGTSAPRRFRNNKKAFTN